MMSLWDALRMNMMISYQELVRTFPNCLMYHWMGTQITTPSPKLTDLITHPCGGKNSAPVWGRIERSMP
ncbi:hypothetical protein CEO44_28410 [Klebsiella pneumoniae]|nr:hypothetical protein CEO56_28415 [Klebsiella pneumoniae]OZM33255.1 hypothetical protein CEO46_28410 [Klebsiella pneumoniae]OZM44545.1 hypothetical protein CEO44_28410 [Klebsiella pneumoniae]OZM59003.1 hypothetical protein CEO42_27720 [Klebsiella pneumoniae]